MKKVIVSLLLLVLLVPTIAFAANRTNPKDIYESVVGSAPEQGARLNEQAEQAGKGQEFFEAMQDSQAQYFKDLATEGVLTQDEADFLISKLTMTYADQQKMQQIQDKLRDQGQGFGMMGGFGPMHGRGQGNWGKGMNPENCPMNPNN